MHFKESKANTFIINIILRILDKNVALCFQHITISCPHFVAYNKKDTAERSQNISQNIS
jgi:hypothetical protein